MSDRTGRIIDKMTPAQRRAIKDAWQASWGEWFVPTNTRMDVRRALIQHGLLSKRPAYALLAVGRDVRERLIPHHTNGGSING